MKTAKVKNVANKANLVLSFLGVVVSAVLITCKIIDAIEEENENKQISNT